MKQNFLLSVYLFAGLLAIIFSSCKHDLDVPANPQISFGTDVRTIISGNCTFSGCHGSVDFKRIQLLTYDDVIKNGGIGNSDATKTKLYQSITGKGADIMPPSSYSTLTDLQIQTILLWIRQGAKNN